MNSRKPSDDTTECFSNFDTVTYRRGKLIIITGSDLGLEHILNNPEITIGSNSSNDVVLSDKAVSRKHAVLKEVSNGYMIKDLESTNGTFVDGYKIREIFLSFGATIRIGKTELQYVPFEEKANIDPSLNDHFGDCYGNSIKMRTIFSILEKVSKSNATIIFEGGTGTGKELLAKAVHTNSLRVNEPFVIFDCGAVAENLIESELFGHEKGSFTGAVSSRAGVFEQANHGTVFLDEIGELALDLQPKLLRVLEQGKIKRVGGNKYIPVDVRIIAATNRNLQNEVKKGDFREDLFYRLAVIGIDIPSLRERKEDIEFLALYFVDKVSEEVGCSPPPSISPEAFELLKMHRWPGNIRELRNVMSRAITMGDRKVITEKDLVFLLSAKARKNKTETFSGKTLDEIEKIVIKEKLQKNSGNKSQTAKDLGIAYSTLFEKMKKYKIH